MWAYRGAVLGAREQGGQVVGKNSSSVNEPGE